MNATIENILVRLHEEIKLRRTIEANNDAHHEIVGLDLAVTIMLEAAGISQQEYLEILANAEQLPLCFKDTAEDTSNYDDWDTAEDPMGTCAFCGETKPEGEINMVDHELDICRECELAGKGGNS